MAPFRFRQFKVYQDAKAFRKHVIRLANKCVEQRAFDLTDQIRRASLSVVLNIAEGSAKRSDIEFARFLETSTGSVNEIVAGFDIAHDEKIISDNDYASIEREAENILMQLGGFIKSLRKNH
ncbi:MAG: four helix bundle protein [Candidatus Peribacteraceae bacterium]|nr:four helix bundle protein [Candidatus Peribacteraceae bacterium]MDD5739470.1 four helix bundle protein [Candidatus Peribacteraceae bacterium]